MRNNNNYTKTFNVRNSFADDDLPLDPMYGQRVLQRKSMENLKELRTKVQRQLLNEKEIS